jgi:hypothetical protein
MMMKIICMGHFAPLTISRSVALNISLGIFNLVVRHYDCNKEINVIIKISISISNRIYCTKYRIPVKEKYDTILLQFEI